MVKAQRLHNFSLDLTAHFREDDNQALTYTYTNSVSHSSWLQLNTSNQKLEGTPPQGLDDSLNMTVTATDITGLSVTSNTFELQILADHPPQITTTVPSIIGCYEGVL